MEDGDGGEESKTVVDMEEEGKEKIMEDREEANGGGEQS